MLRNLKMTCSHSKKIQIGRKVEDNKINVKIKIKNKDKNKSNEDKNKRIKLRK